MYSSTPGRVPAFQASMNSLSTLFRSEVTEDLLQFLYAATAARVDIVHRDAAPGGDLLGGELLQVGHLEDLPVVVVRYLGDRPARDVFRLEPAALLLDGVGAALAQRGVVGSERGVIWACLAAGLEGRVDAARLALVVAELLSAIVPAGVLHARGQGRIELAGLTTLEVRAHREQAHEGLACRTTPLVLGQAGAAGREAEELHDLLDAVEVVGGELFPNLGGRLRVAACASGGIAPQEEVVRFSRHPRGGSRPAGAL